MRIPRRNTPSKRGSSRGAAVSGGVDKRIKVLSIVVGIQSVLLILLFILQLTSGGSKSGVKVPDVADSENIETGSESSSDIQADPTVPVRESGELPPEVALSRPVRIEILNGCGVPKLASKYANALRSEGYDIRDTRNANRSNYTNSFIYDRTSLPGQARRMATILGISQQRVINQPDDRLVDIDLTLILGADYTLLNVSP
ncbi:MAG: LytR C-terminal domain-containing protein [Candidatus Electryonea clarkiae]|nr:LytR C-terminal domain-containing protein [Candidatus Electryonea clarkiae]MDP8288666.1 LytR C-terminal domain-containing protein [Candidatus Electryonea clarkiae]